MWRLKCSSIVAMGTGRFFEWEKSNFYKLNYPFLWQLDRGGEEKESCVGAAAEIKYFQDNQIDLRKICIFQEIGILRYWSFL